MSFVLEIKKTSPLAANSPLGNLSAANLPRTQSLAELEKGSINRPQVLSQSPFSTQPPNLTHDARILNSNLSHSHTAKQGEAAVSLVNAKSLDSKKEAKNEILESNENLESSLRGSETSEAIHNTESSDFDKNRNKINLHEVQQPQEASSGVRERVVREQNLSKITGSDFAIQAPFPSLKVESIGNPCEKDSNQSGNLESNTKASTKLKCAADSIKDSTTNKNSNFTQNLKVSTHSKNSNFTQNLKNTTLSGNLVFTQNLNYSTQNLITQDSNKAKLPNLQASTAQSKSQDSIFQKITESAILFFAKFTPRYHRQRILL